MTALQRNNPVGFISLSFSLSRDSTMTGMSTKTPRRLFVALTFPFVEGFIVARPVTESAASEVVTRLVELGRTLFEDVGDGTRVDVVLQPPPSPRHLLVDASTFSSHSSKHDKLSTSYEGDVPSTGLEFTLENHNADGEYAIISGLGLNVEIITSTAASTEGNSSVISGEIPSAAMESPCRVKVYTKRGEGLHSAMRSTGTISVDDVMAYELALDARVLCKGRGQETLLPSELFLANYGLIKQKGPVVGETGESTTGAIQMPSGSPDVGGVDGGRKMEESTTLDNVENATNSEFVGPSFIDENIENGTNVNTYSSSTTADVAAVSSYVLSPEEKDYPLLIPPNETLSVYILVMTVSDTADGASFLLVSSSESTVSTNSAVGEEEDQAIGEAATYKSDTTFNLHSGLSIINAYTVNGTVDEQKVLQVKPGTIFNGAIYYDTFLPTSTTLGEYYDALEYSFLPGEGVLGKAGCEKSLGTGYIETVGSYGLVSLATLECQ